jgi:Zn-dependent peptidase ImmA (M78 family)
VYIPNIDPAEEWLASDWVRDSGSYTDKETLVSDLFRNIQDYVLNEHVAANEPKNLFRARRILRTVNKETYGAKLASIIPIKGGFVLELAPDKLKTRQRFTIAHELGHTFFFNLQKEVPGVDFLRRNSKYWVRERYSSRIAGEILVPRASIEKVLLVNNMDAYLDALDRLRSIYSVSFEVMSRRLVSDLEIWDCMVVMSKHDDSEGLRIDQNKTVRGKSFQKWKVTQSLRERLEEKIEPAKSGYHKDIFVRRGAEYRIESLRYGTTPDGKSVILTMITL